MDPVAQTAGGPATHTRVAIQSIADISHSGRGAFHFYNKAAEKSYTIYSDASTQHVRELIFHSIWGSHLEDLNVLKYMTDIDFSTRNAFGNTLRKKGSTTNLVVFTPIKLLKYAKLSQAATTDYNQGGQAQITNRITFSGKRRAMLSDGFKTYYKKKRADQSVAAS